MINVEDITPKWDLVIVKLLNLENLQELIIQDKSDETDIAIRFGEVLSFGQLANQLEHCPGITIGDKVIFTEYAGYYIASKDNKTLYKVIRAYDIIGKKMNDETLETPTGNRVLIELIDLNDQEDSIIFNVKDPKLADLSYGKILKINTLINKMNLSKGQLVAFAPYSGTTIRHQESLDKKELKIIVEEDILFTV